MNVEETTLPGVLLIHPAVFGDERGFFSETYHLARYQEAGVPDPFVQDNHSQSSHGVLRGLHYQIEHPQGKLISVLTGEIFDVAVDIRRGSPTFGSWTGATLSADNHRQLYVPPGFAHGFCVTSDRADVMYKCTDIYFPAGDRGVLWSDPRLGIDWPVASPDLSEKDQRLPLLQDIPEADLPVYPGSDR